MIYKLDESTSTLVKKTSHLYVRLANQHLKLLNVPHAYALFLLQLLQNDGQTQASLYKVIGIEQPTAVRTLDRMERDKFITRVRSETDRREIKIFLTKKAWDLEEKLIRCAETINQVALEGFTVEEKKLLNKFLTAIIQKLEKNF